jgi:hypothetical protein
VEPTFTFPKNRVVGTTLKMPPVVVVVVDPFPLIDSVVVGFEAFEVNETASLTEPLAVGVKDIAMF